MQTSFPAPDVQEENNTDEANCNEPVVQSEIYLITDNNPQLYDRFNSDIRQIGRLIASALHPLQHPQ